MLTSKIADPGVVINESSAFPADVTPVASPMPQFPGATPNAPLTDSTSTSAASGEGSIRPSEEVETPSK